MAIESYDDLLANMPKWLKRPDLVPLLPTFISLAEELLENAPELRTAKARRQTVKMTPNSGVISLPSDYKKIKAVYYGGAPLSFSPEGVLSGYGGNVSYSNYLQSAYQINGDSMTLSVPQLGQILQIDYYAVLEPLSESNPSNWLLEDSPNTYLFASLVQAATYVRDDSQTQRYAALGSTAMSNVQDDNDSSQYPDGGLVIQAF